MPWCRSDPRHGELVDVLDHQRADTRRDQLGYGVGDLVDRREGDQQGGPVLGAGQQLENDPGDDGQRTLGADQELCQVVAARGLDQLAAGLDDLTVGQHRFEPQDVVSGHSVLDRAHAAGIGGDVASQGGAALAGEDRIDESLLASGLVELGEGHAGLHHRHVVLGIDLQDSIHALEGDQDASTAGYAGPRETGAVAPGGDRDASLVGQAQHPRDLLRGGRPHYHLGVVGVYRECLVVRVLFADRIAGQHLLRGHDVGEKIDQVVHRSLLNGPVPGEGTAGISDSIESARDSLPGTRFLQTSAGGLQIHLELVARHAVA